MLGAWQHHQTRVSYIALNRDNQGAWEAAAFDWSQEAGGHDLGMALTGEGYFEEHFSDEEREALAISGGGKLLNKGVEYGGQCRFSALCARQQDSSSWTQMC